MMRRDRRSRSGTTLVELLIVLSTATLLLTLGVSGLTSLINRNRLAVAANELLSLFTLARATAVTRGRAVTICAWEPSHQDCHRLKQDWSVADIAVAIDNDGDGKVDQLSRLHRLDSSVRAYTDAPSVTFDALGSTSDFTAILCDTKGAKRITVAAIGRAAILEGQPGDCP